MAATVKSLSEQEIEFLKNLAFSNQSAMCAFLTDRDINDILPVVGLFDQVTRHEIYSFVHVYGYKHVQYLNFLKTLFMNAPMDLSTRIVRGEDSPALDLQIYDDCALDVVVTTFSDAQKTIDLVPFAWRKLKPNGSLVLRGLPESRKEELQNAFARNVPNVPSNIRINIFCVENVPELYYVKKPCY